MLKFASSITCLHRPFFPLSWLVFIDGFSCTLTKTLFFCYFPTNTAPVAAVSIFTKWTFWELENRSRQFSFTQVSCWVESVLESTCTQNILCSVGIANIKYIHMSIEQEAIPMKDSLYPMRGDSHRDIPRLTAEWNPHANKTDCDITWFLICQVSFIPQTLFYSHSPSCGIYKQSATLGTSPKPESTNFDVGLVGRPAALEWKSSGCSHIISVFCWAFITENIRIAWGILGPD